MRPGQHNKRSRGRSRHRGSSGGGSGGGGNPLSRVYDSNGPDVKVRGTAQTIAEKYLQLGRDAQSSGDIVAAESYYQHAEHYLRIVAAAQAYNQQLQQQYRKPGEDYEGEEGEDTGEGEGDDGDAASIERTAYGDQPDQPTMQAEQPFEGDRPQQQYRQRDREQGRDRKPRWENRRDYSDQPRESHNEQRQQSQPRSEDQPPVQAEATSADADRSSGNWEAPSFLRKPSGNGSGRQRYERKPRKESAPEGEAASEPAPEPVVDAPQSE
jgi:Domain of unknown function (DUF4167)